MYAFWSERWLKKTVAMAASEIEQRIQRALKALRAGDKEQARSILLSVVDEQEDNERAWLYLSAAVETLEEQQICLENVLAINPANEKARQGLERVNKALAARRSGPTASAAPAPSPSPFVTTDFSSPAPPSAKSPFVEDVTAEQSASGAWFAAGPFVEQPSLPTEPDPYVPATSVDWARDDRPAVYGSGRHVELPSDQDYEEWVRSLNLGGAGARAAESQESASPWASGGGWASGTASSPFTLDEDSRRNRDAERGRQQGAAGDTSFEESLRSTISFDEEIETAAQDNEPSWPPFWRETPDEVIEPSAAELSRGERISEVGGTRSRTGEPEVSDPASYYALIPDDIEVVTGVSGWRAAIYLLGIALLLVLNALSFGYLLR